MRYAERFELYIGGLEICNAFSELTDPVEQRERFERQKDSRLKSGKPVYPMPEKFLTALDNMPAAAGNALGIDRLVMLFSDSKQIDNVVAFTPEEL
jgi:lysyl-tRNA synthetase class 2